MALQLANLLTSHLMQGCALAVAARQASATMASSASTPAERMVEEEGILIVEMKL